MRAILTTFCLFVCVTVTGSLCAETVSSPTNEDWTEVTSLRPGRRVTVRLHKGHGKKVRGVFVSGDSGGVTVLNRQRAELTLPRDHVRTVKAERERRYGKWVGMAVGATVIGLTVNRAFARSSDDLSTGGHLAVLGFGAGLGALVGILVDRANVLVYKAPKGDSPAGAATSTHEHSKPVGMATAMGLRCQDGGPRISSPRR